MIYKMILYASPYYNLQILQEIKKYKLLVMNIIKNQYGLLGKGISYSFSKTYFTEKFKKLKILNSSSYELFDFNQLAQINSLFNLKNLIGFNVTIPYKETIISYLNCLSYEAKKIKSVNCVHIIKNKKIGYNTDSIAFKTSLIKILKNYHKTAIVLGDGGASKSVCYALKQLNIEYLIVSRKGLFKFKDLKKEHFQQYLIWIQTTPIGTFPNTEEMLDIPTIFFNSKHIVYDLIYNPNKTKLIKKAQAQGAITKNGLEMLYLQAEASWKIWNSKKNTK